MENAQTKLEFEAIGTSWTIDFTLPDNLSTADIKQKVLALIEEFGKVYSRFRPDSLVSKMHESPGEYVLPQRDEKLFNVYQDLYKLSNGMFTPLIGNALIEAGYDSNYSLQGTAKTPVPAWEDVIEYNFPKIVLKSKAILDFGAGGKGYLVDLIGSLLKKEGVEDFCVDAGGDILHSSANTNILNIGLEDPNNFEQAIGIAKIQNQSLCASAGNRRKWGKYHHILDPKKLSSPSEILAVWVVAKEALTSDALATCLFFTKAEVLKTRYDFEYLILKQNYSAEISKNFPGKVFKNT